MLIQTDPAGFKVKKPLEFYESLELDPAMLRERLGEPKSFGSQMGWEFEIFDSYRIRVTRSKVNSDGPWTVLGTDEDVIQVILGLSAGAPVLPGPNAPYLSERQELGYIWEQRDRMGPKGRKMLERDIARLDAEEVKQPQPDPSGNGNPVRTCLSPSTVLKRSTLPRTVEASRPEGQRRLSLIIGGKRLTAAKG